MQNVRLWHSYLAVLIAPSVLFFASTGALQLFDLHEAHGSYQPAAVIEKLGRVHKDQVFEPAEHHHGGGPGASGPPGVPGQAAQHADDDDATPLHTLLLKCFFLFVALGLITSTCLGLWIAFTRQRRKRLAWTLLIIGAAMPLLLLVI